MMNDEPPTRVELRVSCNGMVQENEEIPNSNVTVIANLQDANKTYVEIGRTERIAFKNHLNFNTTVEVVYCFEVLQRMQFVITGVPISSTSAIEEENFGEAVFTLGQIVAQREVTSKLSTNIGSITVTVEAITDANIVEFEVFAEKLHKKDLFGKCNPFMRLYREKENGMWREVYKTEVIEETSHPHWKAFTLRFQTLCKGDKNKKIKFSCFDFDAHGNHDFIGDVVLRVADVLQKKELPCRLANPRRKTKKNDKGTGKLTIKKCEITTKNSFLEYIYGGCELHLTCGIDFTGSNGDPKHNSSLHYTGSVNPNDYVQSIRAVCNVIQDYDSEKQYPVYGFGAKIPPDNEVSDEFPINFDEENPACVGVDGILEEYHKVLKTVKLWGPTNISPIIDKAAQMAENVQSQTQATHYYILLILTDGVITDVDETKEAIVGASALPMSVAFVGIGNADFSAIEALKSTKKMLKSPTGKEAARDIIAFAPFRKFKFASPISLARSVLADIPSQIVKYFEMNKLPPNRVGEDNDETVADGPKTPKEKRKKESQIKAIKKTVDFIAAHEF